MTNATAAEREKPGSPAVWWTAVRPFAYTGSVLPVLLGAALACYDGYALRWGLLVLTLAGVICFHTAANLLNDYHDYRRGLDRQVHPVSGALVRGWLTERRVLLGALFFLGTGFIIGAALVLSTGWPVLAFGAVGAFLVLFYTRSGFCLKYAGLGDLAIFIAFSIPVPGAYYVQAGSLAWQPLHWSLPMVSYTVAILHANNWRDLHGDSARQCRTVASALGETGSKIYYRFLILMPYLVVVSYLWLDRGSAFQIRTPASALIVLLTLPVALRLCRIDREGREDVFNMLDARTAQLHLMFGMMLIVGFVIGCYLRD